MSKKEYPLDITLACVIALQGGLEKYADILPSLPKDSLQFIKEWNRALLWNCSRNPEFKKHLGGFGRAIALIKSPKLTAALLDKIAVPYRSYYYAKRFSDAYGYSDSVLQNNIGVNIVDFGRGLSPLIHLLGAHHEIKPYSIDIDTVGNSLFAKTSTDIGLNSGVYSDDWKAVNEHIGDKKDLFLSLGTFAYINKKDAREKLEYIAKNYPNFFIELEKENIVSEQQDGKLVKNMGTEYQPGWSETEIKEIFGSEAKLQPLSDIEIQSNKFKKLKNSLGQSTESFLQR
jgi:hypothetical protein